MNVWVCLVRKEVFVGGESQRCRHTECGEMAYAPAGSRVAPKGALLIERDIGGMERGYSVDDICNKEGCEVAINRGLAYCCGNSPYAESDSCANYFCDEHMVYTGRGQRCEACAALVVWEMVTDE